MRQKNKFYLYLITFILLLNTSCKNTIHEVTKNPETQITNDNLENVIPTENLLSSEDTENQDEIETKKVEEEKIVIDENLSKTIPPDFSKNLTPKNENDFPDVDKNFRETPDFFTLGNDYEEYNGKIKNFIYISKDNELWHWNYLIKTFNLLCEDVKLITDINILDVYGNLWHYEYKNLDSDNPIMEKKLISTDIADISGNYFLKTDGTVWHYKKSYGRNSEKTEYYYNYPIEIMDDVKKLGDLEFFKEEHYDNLLVIKNDSSLWYKGSIEEEMGENIIFLDKPIFLDSQIKDAGFAHILDGAGSDIMLVYKIKNNGDLLYMKCWKNITMEILAFNSEYELSKLSDINHVYSKETFTFAEAKNKEYLIINAMVYHRDLLWGTDEYLYSIQGDDRLVITPTNKPCFPLTFGYGSPFFIDKNNNVYSFNGVDMFLEVKNRDSESLFIEVYNGNEVFDNEANHHSVIYNLNDDIIFK